MDAKEFFYRRHDQIVTTWMQSLRADRSTRYHLQPPDDLHNSLSLGAFAFRRVMLEDDWSDLEKLIAYLAQKRFRDGFKVSEVQKAFEHYRQTVTPLLFADVDPSELESLIIQLQQCMIFTITRFSEYFQEIHENFLRNHAAILEKEIEIRTRELAESRQKYKTLVEDINDGFVVLIEGRVVFANRSFAQMHGRRHEEVLDADYLDFVAEEHRERILRVCKPGCCGSDAPSRIEYRRLCKDGGKRPTEIMAKRSLYGDRPASIGICRDTSERVELEKRTREAEKLKALANQAAALAHEVRNPLSTVRLNLQLFSRTDMEPERLRLLHASLDEVDRIERSLQEVMEISFPLRLSLQPVDLGQLLERCLDSMHERLTSNQVAASLKLSRRIERINADPHRLEQALINLLFNAVEAQSSGGRVAISVRPYKEGADPWVDILILDQGPGVPEEMLPYLFDPTFSQKAMGNGLGLHNVKRIIAAHGGSVRAKPNRLRGMSFHLSLPVG